MSVMRFSVEPPRSVGKPFEAQYDGKSVTSNRDGEWKEETRLTLADLMFPEQAFIEWDIRQIDATDVADANPYHDPENGQFTTAGWFTGSTVIKRNGRKMSQHEHKIFAEHPDDVPGILIRNRKMTARKDDEVLVVGEIKQVAGDTRKHASKYPNKGSKEYEALQEMQRRVDEQKGYKGD